MVESSAYKKNGLLGYTIRTAVVSAVILTNPVPTNNITQLKIASDSNTDAHTLSLLSKFGSLEVREEVSFRDKKDKETEAVMSKDPEERIKHGLAMSTKDKDLLDRYAQDRDELIRWHVAWNENTRIETRIELMLKDNEFVSDKAREVLRDMLKDPKIKTGELLAIRKSEDKELGPIATKELEKRWISIKNNYTDFARADPN